MSEPATVIIADDHPLFRAALCDAVAKEFPDCQVREAADFNQLQHLVETTPDALLAVVDLHMPGAHGFSALIFLVAHFVDIPVLMISANDAPETIRRAADHGASGFLPKSADALHIKEAIQAVSRGEHWFPSHVDLSTSEVTKEESGIADALASLTPQQFKVATMLSRGLLNKQIAYELNVTEATVKAHITEVFRKLGVHSRTQAALALGKLDLEMDAGTGQED